MTTNYASKDYTDFNDAENQRSYDLIPHKTIAKVCLHIKPGGYDNVPRNWTGGYATCNEKTGAVYLKCDFTVMEGPHYKKKVFSMIGLHSEKGETWANMGRAFIKAILNSARGIHRDDQSPKAVEGRRLQNGLCDLEGLEFWGLIEEETQEVGDEKKQGNILKKVIMPGQQGYPADYPGVVQSFSSESADPGIMPGIMPSLPSWAP